MDDAYTLGRLLTMPEVTSKNLGKILSIYESIRRPIAHDALDRSLRLSRVIMFVPGFIPKDVDVEKVKANDKDELQKIAQEMERIWSFNDMDVSDTDWARAKELYDKEFSAGELN